MYDKSSFIAQNWKQLRLFSMGEWINNPWYIQTVEYCSSVKINEIFSHGKTWKKLKSRLLNEKLHTVIPALTSWKKQNDGDSEKINGCQGLRGGREG